MKIDRQGRKAIRVLWPFLGILALHVLGSPLLFAAACPFDPEVNQIPIVASSIINDPDGFPNVLIIVDISGSMNNINWVEGYDPRGTPDPNQPGEFISHPQYQYYNFTSGAWQTVTRPSLQADNMNGVGGRIVSTSTGYIYARIPGQSQSRRLRLPLPDGLAYSGSNAVRFDERYLGYLFYKYAFSGDYPHQPDPVYAEPNYSPYYTVWSMDITDRVPDTHRMATARDVTKRILSDNYGKLRFGLMQFNLNEGGSLAAPVGSSLSSLLSAVDAMDSTTNTPLGESLYEAYRSFAGRSGYYNSTSYSSPINFYCQKNFIVIVTDGDPYLDTNYPSGLKSTIDSACDADPFCLTYKTEIGYASSGFPWQNPAITNNNEMGRTLMDGIAYWLHRCRATDSYWPLVGPGSPIKAAPVNTYAIGFAIDHPLLSQTAKVGNGLYFTARSADELSDALEKTIADIVDRSYSISGLAFSSPTYRAGSTYVVTTQFMSGDWTGDVVRQNIQISWDAEGNVTSYSLSNPVSAAAHLPPWQSRMVYTDHNGALAPVDAINLGLNNLPGYEDDPDYGPALADYLKGDPSNEIGGKGFRYRAGLFPDVVHSAPAVDVDEGMIYVGGNGGMLHAIELSTMEEKWSYIPSLLKDKIAGDFPVLAHLAKSSYSDNHRYYVDLSANVKRLGDEGSGQRAYLVGGLRGGGEGYFCLDVTNPLSPLFKWKLDASTVSGLGYSFSEPQLYYYEIPGSGGEGDPIKVPVMVIGNGYGCQSGSGLSDRLLIVNLDTGNIIANIATGEAHGGLTTPVIYGRKNALRIIYAGDLGGNLWRFKAPATAAETFTAQKLWSFGAPISSQLNVSVCQNVPVVLGGTGRYLEPADVLNTESNYLFAIRDMNGEGQGWWRIDLSGGERSISTPEVVWNESWFVSLTPSADVCSQGGSSRMYRIAVCPSVEESQYSGGDGAFQFTLSDLMLPPKADPDDPNPSTTPQFEIYDLAWIVLSNPRTIEDEHGHTAVMVQGSVTGDDAGSPIAASSFEVMSGNPRPMSLGDWQVLRWLQNLNR